MIARATPCDRELLRQVLRDGGDTVHQRQLEDHLTTCDLCRHELERLAGGDDWLFEVREHLSSSEVQPYLNVAVIAPRDEPSKLVPAFSESLKHPAHHAERDGYEQIRFDPTDHLNDDHDDKLNFLEPSTDPSKLGRLGIYEIESVIGRGGMGIVLKAFDSTLNRHVAIKVLAAELATSGAARRRFARESQAAAAIVHEHVVAIHAVDNSGKLPFLVMPYIPGKSLQERLDESGPLEIKEILRISLQAAAGLAAAHAQGLVHRDIKPANILLENGIERVRITDFGLARAVDDASQTQSGFIAGTPQYMAPEQARGEPVDHRADLFSLGSVMYAMCTGRPPFRAETTLAVLRRICEETPRPIREINPDIPGWMQAVIGKLHARDPEERFQTATEVAELLEQYLAHLQQPATCPRPRFHGADQSWKIRLKQMPARLVLWSATGALIAGMIIWYRHNTDLPEVYAAQPVARSTSIPYSAGDQTPTGTSPIAPSSGPPGMGNAPGTPASPPATSRQPDPWEIWDQELQVVSDDVQKLERIPAVRLVPGSPVDLRQELDEAARRLQAVEAELRK